MTSNILLKNNLSGVIVLYNPDNSTEENIATYIDQLTHLYVVDNSEMINKALIERICALQNNISYHPAGQNLGIAKALNHGCELAAADGYKWILTMDQDSHFENDTFFKEVYNTTFIDTAIIAASYNDIYFSPKSSEYPGFTEVAFVITSGNILNLAAWNQIGRFTEKLFIDEVDNEFCIRAINQGFKILVSDKIYLLHKLGDGLRVNHFLTRKEIVLTRHSPARIYYTIRNNIYLWRKFAFSNFGFVINRMRNILHLITKILIYFPNKKEYLRYAFKGLGDSIKGKYGRLS